jgi:hypothetical protein
MQPLVQDCCPPEMALKERAPVIIQYGHTKYWTSKLCSCGWQTVIPYENVEKRGHIYFRCTNPSCAKNRRALGNVEPLEAGYNEMFGV